MPLRLAEFGREECLHEVPGHDMDPQFGRPCTRCSCDRPQLLAERKSDRAPAQRERRDLVSTDGRANTTAANSHAAIHRPRRYGSCKWNDVVWIVVS